MIAQQSRGLEPGFAVACDDDLLRITQADGDPARHVVSFTGIGWGMQGIQTEEWRKTLGAGGSGTATYVIDKQRGWYNSTYEPICRHLAALAAGSGRVTTLGNSMGGFGALYFASAIPHCARAVAFAPQFSVNPALMPPKETRWAQYRRQILTHHRGHALEHPSADIDYIAFYGEGTEIELAHARRLARVATPRTFIFLVGDCEHDVAATVKQAGLLPNLLDLLLGDAPFRPGAMVRLLREGGIKIRRIGPGTGTGTAQAPAA